MHPRNPPPNFPIDWEEGEWERFLGGTLLDGTGEVSVKGTSRGRWALEVEGGEREIILHAGTVSRYNWDDMGERWAPAIRVATMAQHIERGYVSSGEAELDRSILTAYLSFWEGRPPRCIE